MDNSERLEIHRGALLHRGIMVSDETASEEELLGHVLWFWPTTDSSRQRLRWLSMVEGIMALGDAFGTGKVDSALLEKSRLVFVELESELWMVWSIDQFCDPKAAQSAILQVWDSCWTLFHGPLIHQALMNTQIEDSPKSLQSVQSFQADNQLLFDQALRTTLDRLLQPAIRRLWKAHVGRLADLVGFEHSGADASLVLCTQRAQSLARKCCGPDIKSQHCSIFLGANLVWNGLELADSLPLYRYLVAFVLTPDPDNTSFIQTRGTTNPLAASRQRSGLSSGETNGLIYPPSFLTRDSNPDKQHIWFLRGYGHQRKPPHNLSNLQWFLSTRTPDQSICYHQQMCLYQAGDWTLVILAPQLPELGDDSDFLALLAAAAAPLLAAPPRPPRRLRGSPVDGCDFVYFNRANLSLKLGFDPPLRTDAHRVLDDVLAALATQTLHFQRHPLLSPNGVTREICVPLLCRGWLIAKLYDKRLIVLILDSRFANFQQAQDAVVGLKGGLLSNITILP